MSFFKKSLKAVTEFFTGPKPAEPQVSFQIGPVAPYKIEIAEPVAEVVPTPIPAAVADVIKKAAKRPTPPKSTIRKEGDVPKKPAAIATAKKVAAKPKAVAAKKTTK